MTDLDGNGDARPWRLLLHGRPRLQAVFTCAVEIALSERDAAWLALVALGGGMETTRLAALAWSRPGRSRDPRTSPLVNLRQRVFRLRRTARGVGAATPQLVTLGDVPSLASDLTWKPPSEDALRDDPAAWDGDLLGPFAYDGEGEFTAWLSLQRNAFAQRRRDVLAGLAAEAESGGELARALRFALQLQRHEPLSEHALRRVIRLHHRRGDAPTAIAAVEVTERLLWDELGMRLSAETADLLRTIETGLAAPPVHATFVAAPMPIGLLRPPRLVGRSALMAALDAARAEGALAVLVGEAGVGKSRLIDAHLQQSSGGVPACVVQARLGDAMIPFAVARKLMEALGRPAADAHKVRFGDAESALVDARGRGLPLLVVDDLHHADRASIELLCALAGAEAIAGLPWLLAHRPLADADDDAAMLRALAEAPQVRWLEVAPLDADDLADLLASLGVPGLDAEALAPKLWRQGGGNPLYALETLRAMQAAGSDFGADALPRPQTVSQLIRRRLARLSPRALALARVAAIAVPDFSAALAEKALGEPAAALADAWAELEGAGVLRGLGFAHDLVHDEARRSVPQAIGEHLHALVAQHLAASGAEAARLAPHWVGAARWSAAAEALVAAARQAERAGREVESGRLAWQAAEARQRAGDVSTAVRLGALTAISVAQVEGSDAASGMLDRLSDWAAGDASLAVWPLLTKGTRAYVLGTYADADEFGLRALASATSAAEQILATIVRGLALSAQGRNDEAMTAMQAVRALADLADDDTAQRFWGNYGTALLHAQRFTEGREALGRALDMARRRESADEVTHLVSLTGANIAAGDAEAAVALSLELDSRLGGDKSIATLATLNRMNLGGSLAALGRYTEALAQLEPTIAEFAALRMAPEHASIAETWLVQACLQLGQTARALALARRQPSGLADHRMASRLLVHAQALRAAGKDDAALLHEAQALCHAPAGAATRLTIEIALVRHDHPGIAGLARLRELERDPLAQERAPIALLAGLEALDLALSVAPDTLDADMVAALEARVPHCRSLFLDLPRELHRCARAWRALGRPAEARRALDAAMSALMHAARHTVPEPFVRSYLAYPAHAALTRDAASF